MDKIQIKLFVSGLSDRNNTFLQTLKELCLERFKGNCDIELINVLEEPEKALSADVIATPTLIRNSPKPRKRALGSLGNKEKIFSFLTP